jgi:predicted ArsR family transcriptional regulator
VPDGGLGQNAVRTWQEVRSAGDGGITVDELCTAVGYQSRTILKHLKVLAQDGLAEPHGERWRSTGRQLL